MRRPGRGESSFVHRLLCGGRERRDDEWWYESHSCDHFRLPGAVLGVRQPPEEFASALQPLARRSRAFRRLAVASLPETSLEFIARLAHAWLL